MIFSPVRGVVYTHSLIDGALFAALADYSPFLNFAFSNKAQASGQDDCNLSGSDEEVLRQKRAAYIQGCIREQKENPEHDFKSNWLSAGQK